LAVILIAVACGAAWGSCLAASRFVQRLVE
jgi:hypothetical protein